MKRILTAVAVALSLAATAQVSTKEVYTHLETMESERTLESGSEVLFFTNQPDMTEMQIYMAQFIVDRVPIDEVQKFDNVSDNGIEEEVTYFQWVSPMGTVFRLFIGVSEGYENQVGLTRASKMKRL